MMETAHTNRPISRTLSVIEGGLSSTAGMQVLPTTQKPKLLEQVRQAIRTRHYSYMTDKALRSLDQAFYFLPQQAPSGRNG